MSVMDRLKKNSKIKGSDILSESKIFSQQDFAQTPVPMINVALSGDPDGGLGSGLTVLAGPSKHFKTSFALLMAAASGSGSLQSGPLTVPVAAPEELLTFFFAGTTGFDTFFDLKKTILLCSLLQCRDTHCWCALRPRDPLQEKRLDRRNVVRTKERIENKAPAQGMRSDSTFKWPQPVSNCAGAVTDPSSTDERVALPPPVVPSFTLSSLLRVPFLGIAGASKSKRAELFVCLRKQSQKR